MGIFSSALRAVESRLGKTVVKEAAADTALKTTAKLGGTVAEKTAVSGGKSYARAIAERAASGVSVVAKPAAITAGVVATAAGATLVSSYAFDRGKQVWNQTPEQSQAKVNQDIAKTNLELATKALQLQAGAQALNPSSGTPATNPLMTSPYGFSSFSSPVSSEVQKAATTSNMVSNIALATVVVTALAGTAYVLGKRK